MSESRSCRKEIKNSNGSITIICVRAYLWLRAQIQLHDLQVFATTSKLTKYDNRMQRPRCVCLHRALHAFPRHEQIRIVSNKTRKKNTAREVECAKQPNQHIDSWSLNAQTFYLWESHRTLNRFLLLSQFRAPARFVHFSLGNFTHNVKIKL